MPKGRPLSAAHKRAISNSLKGKGRGGSKTVKTMSGKSARTKVAPHKNAVGQTRKRTVISAGTKKSQTASLDRAMGRKATPKTGSVGAPVDRRTHIVKSGTKSAPVVTVSNRIGGAKFRTGQKVSVGYSGDKGGRGVGYGTITGFSKSGHNAKVVTPKGKQMSIPSRRLSRRLTIDTSRSNKRSKGELIRQRERKYGR